MIYLPLLVIWILPLQCNDRGAWLVDARMIFPRSRLHLCSKDAPYAGPFHLVRHIVSFRLNELIFPPPIDFPTASRRGSDFVSV